MWGASLVDSNPQAGVLPHQRACGASIVQVNVREHQVCDVGEAQPIAIQSELECLVAGRWSRVNERDVARRADDGRGDGVRPPLEVQVDVGNTGGNRNGV